MVVVQGAHKSYGSGKKKVTVLDNLDMRVPQGAMYVASERMMEGEGREWIGVGSGIEGKGE